MGSGQGTLYKLGLSLFKRLIGLYPDRYRKQYADEIFGVLEQGLEEAGASGGAAVPAFVLRESGAVIASIIRERRHERRGWKEDQTVGEETVYHQIHVIFLRQRLKRASRLVFLLAALIPLYYGCTYSFAVIQLAQAKQRGVYPTLEEAVYSLPAREFRGARVVRVDLNHAEPCYPDGKLPFIWCVTSTVFYDRKPEGTQHTVFRGSGAYFHLQEGWVLIPEQEFSGFIGGILERYGLEGVGQ